MNRQDVYDECKKICNAETIISDLAAKMNSEISKKEKKRIQKELDLFNALRKRRIGPDGINLPAFLQHQYDYLYDVMIDQGEIYGAYYQIKDILEMLLKLPVLIMVHGIEGYVKQGNLNENVLRLLTPLLTKAPSLGDWEVFENNLKNIKDSKDIPVIEDLKVLHQRVLTVIKRIEKKQPSYQEFTKIQIENSKEKKVTFSGYRNAKMGHGATSIVIDTFFNEFKAFLALLNAILDKSGYDGILFEENNDVLIVSCMTDDKKLAVSVAPYIKIGMQNAFPAASMMESYYGKKETAYLLNYSTGAVEESKTLFETLQQINNRITSAGKKLTVAAPTKANMRDDRNIKTTDYISTFADVPFVIENKAFTGKIKEWLNNADPENTICFIQAERGMGKSVFARMNTHDARYSLSAPATKSLGETKQLLVWSYIVNDTFSSSENHFFNRLTGYFDRIIREASDTLDLDVDYENAKSALRLAVSNRTATGVIWHDYFNQLDIQIRRWVCNEDDSQGGAHPRVLLMIDGVDELDIQRQDRLHFEDIFSQQNPLFVVLLGRKKEELVRGDETLYYYQSLEEMATANYVIDRKEPLYIETLISYIQGQLVNNENNVDIDRILKLAEYRFVYVSMLCRIYRANPEDFRVNLVNPGQEKFSFLNAYLNSICFIDQKYRNKLEQLLLILGLVREPVTREELSYLLFNYDLGIPDFQINALLQDLGVVKSMRSAQGNTYLLENKIWYDELDSTTFAARTNTVQEALRTRAEAVACGKATCPHIKNWTLLFERFLDKEYYRDPTVVDNILHFLNTEFDLSLYVQERLVKILNSILEVNKDSRNLASLMVLQVKNWLAAAYYMCGRNQEGLALMKIIAEDLTRDDSIPPSVKASIFFNMGCFKEAFERNDGTYPGASKKLYEEAYQLLDDDSLWQLKCTCLYKLAKTELDEGNFEIAQEHLNVLDKIIKKKQGYDTPNYIALLVLKYMLVMLKLSSEYPDAKEREELTAEAENYSQKILHLTNKIEYAYKKKDNASDKALPTDLDKNFITLYQAFPLTEFKIKAYQIASIQKQAKSEFANAADYIDKAIKLAKQAVSASALHGVLFEEARLIPLQIEKLRLTVSDKLHNKQKIKKENYAKTIEIIETLMQEEQELHGENALITDAKKQLEKIKVVINDESKVISKGYNYLQESGYGNEYNIIQSNMLLAEEVKSDTGKIGCFEKALTQAKKCLGLNFPLKGVKAKKIIQGRFFDEAVLNDEANFNVLQAILDTLCEAEVKLAGLYATVDPLKIRQYCDEAIFIYEIVLKTEPFCSGVWLAKEEVKIRLAECYALLARQDDLRQNEKLFYYDKQIALLESLKNYIRVDFQEHAYKVMTGIIKADDKNCSEDYISTPVRQLLAEAYLEKGKACNTRVSKDECFDNAILYYFATTRPFTVVVDDKPVTYECYDAEEINQKLAECYSWKGLNYFDGGLEHSLRNMHVLIDKTRIQKARECFEEMLHRAQLGKNKTQTVMGYFQLCCVNATLFDLEPTNDTSYAYFEKYLTAFTQMDKSDQQIGFIHVMYYKMLKILFYSLTKEMRELKAKCTNAPNTLFGEMYSSIITSLNEKKKLLSYMRNERKKIEAVSTTTIVLESIRNRRNENRLREEQLRQLALEINNIEQEIAILKKERNAIMRGEAFKKAVEQMCLPIQNKIDILQERIQVVRRKAIAENVDLNTLQGVVAMDALDHLILQKIQTNS